MKAFRNMGGHVTEIQVDIDPRGLPILPPNTTVDERPGALEGHYVTVVDKNWVQIPIPVAFQTFESKRQTAVGKLKEWSIWYFEQPAMHNEVKFDADKTARERLTQAVTGFLATGSHTPFWVAYDDSIYPLADGDALKALAVTIIQTTFSARFFEYNVLRTQVQATTTEAELDAIVLPVIVRDRF